MEKITRESWELIAENIINIVEDNKNFGNDEITMGELEDYLTNEGIIEVMKEYKYGMRLRGFSPMCQPMRGFIERLDDQTGRYYDILVYDRKLTERELSSYELDELA